MRNTVLGKCFSQDIYLIIFHLSKNYENMRNAMKKSFAEEPEK